ncbi:MAG: helix-turn-helix transcriptional regulator [Pseudomonadota bacterium]
MTKKCKSKFMVTAGETFGERLARIRIEKGYTQVELAEKMGIIQVLISDYEHDKLRPYHHMIAQFAQALEVSADELLGLTSVKSAQDKPNLKLLRRMKKIEGLPPTQQKTLLRTIDTFLKGAEK